MNLRMFVVLMLVVALSAFAAVVGVSANTESSPREQQQLSKSAGDWRVGLGSRAWDVPLLSPALQVIEIDASDSGWYTHAGYHGPDNTNYMVGECAPPQCSQSVVFRNFLVFDLTTVAGQILTASLMIENPDDGYESADSFETWTVFDVSTPITTLVAGGSGLTDIYDDLGSGTSYGSAIVTPTSTLVTVQLNSVAISTLDATVGGQFGIGGALTTLDTEVNREWVFGNANESRVRKLVLSVLAPTQPTLSVNYTDGSPGSFFTLTGANFPPNSMASLIVNGSILTSTLAVDGSGGFMLRLDTNQADPGQYFATITVNPSATASFVIDSAAPLRPLGGLV